MTIEIHKFELIGMTSILLFRRRREIKQQKETVRYDTRSAYYSQDGSE